MAKEIEDLTNEELLDEYNYIRNKIDGIVEGGYGKSELNYLEELIRELAIRGA